MKRGSKNILKAVTASACSSAGILLVSNAIIPLSSTLMVLLCALLLFAILTPFFYLSLKNEEKSSSKLIIILTVSALLTLTILAIILFGLYSPLSGEGVLYLISFIYITLCVLIVIFTLPATASVDLTIALTIFVTLFFIMVTSYIIWYLFNRTEEDVIPTPQFVVEEQLIEEEIPTTPVIIEKEEPSTPVIEVTPSIVKEDAEVQEEEVVDETKEIQEESEAEEVVEEESEPVIVAEAETIPSEPLVPSTPTLLTPITKIKDERIYITPDYEEDDFWADFYVQGEDTLSLADGLYYMALYINDEAMGSIAVLIENGLPSIDSAYLESCLSGNITDELNDRLFSGENEYISLSFLEANGVRSNFNSEEYKVSLYISTEDMPIKILSLKGSSSIFQTRPIANAERIEPVNFYLLSRYSLSSSANVKDVESIKSSFRYNLSVSNSFRVFDVYGQFGYSIYNSSDLFNFRFGSYSFYKDFKEQLMRLSWGNVSTDILSAKGTSIGIRLDTSPSYANSSYTRKSHIEKYITIEKEAEVTVINEGREIYRRTLQSGNYRLRDFTLYSGANNITIIVKPTDGSESKEYNITLNYASSLLAPGEIYYGFALASGRSVVNKSSNMISGAFRLPLFNNKALEYDLRNVALSSYIKVGISESLTLNSTLALKNEVKEEKTFNPSTVLAAELTHANKFGSAQYNMRFTTDYSSLPAWHLNFGQQFPTGKSLLSSISLSFSYYGNFEKNNTLSTSLSFSGRIAKKLSYSLSGYLTSSFTENSPFNFSISNSYSMSVSTNMWLSASFSINGGVGRETTFLGRVAATLRFSKLSTGASISSDKSGYLSLNTGNNNNNFSAKITSNDVTLFENYNLAADYSHAGKYINSGISFNSDSKFTTPTLSLYASTQSLYASNAFIISNSIPTNFLLIKQKGALKGNDIAVGSALSSSSDNLDSFFGTYIYRGALSNSNTYLSIFSASEDGFKEPYSLDVMLPSSERNGFVLKLEAEETYTASAIVTIDGKSYLNISSPLYKVENGEFVLTDNYLFTDSEGRFLLSGLSEGTYSFDVQIGKEWVSVSFTIDNTFSSDNVILFENLIKTERESDDVYSSFYTYTLSHEVSIDSYWEMLFPSNEEVV